MGRISIKREVTAPDNLTRQKIITGARKHFFPHGFRSVTMDDLAAELGMSKKTLYACFPSKVSLLEAVIRDKLHDADTNFERVTKNRTANFLDNLQELLACVQQNTEEIRPPFIRDIQREAPELFQLVEDKRRDLIQRHFQKLFNEGRKAGTVRKDIPASLIIEILLGATRSLIIPEKMLELRLTPQTAFTAVLHIILEGALTRCPGDQP